VLHSFRVTRLTGRGIMSRSTVCALRTRMSGVEGWISRRWGIRGLMLETVAYRRRESCLRMCSGAAGIELWMTLLTWMIRNLSWTWMGLSCRPRWLIWLMLYHEIPRGQYRVSHAITQVKMQAVCEEDKSCMR